MSGRGHVVQRSPGSWSIVLYLGRDASGKKRQRWVTFHGDKRDAEKKLTSLLHELDAGVNVDPHSTLVSDFLERWLTDYAQTRVTRKTFERYAQIVRQQLVPQLGHHKLSALRPLHIAAAYTHWLTAGRRDKRKGGLSAQSVVHHHRVLSQALKMAVRWQLLVHNPVEGVDPPRVRRREMRALDDDEISSLLTSAAGDRLYVPILLAVSTGLRRGEILGLRWSDVDMRSGALSVCRSLEPTQDGADVVQPKTARSRRAVRIPKAALEALRRQRLEQEKRADELGAGYQDADLVCPAWDGSPWHPDAFSGAFRSLTGGKVRFHDLRHTAATMLLREGVHPKIVAERLGHSTTRLTLDTYSHVLPGMQEDAVSKIDARLRTMSGLAKIPTD